MDPSIASLWPWLAIAGVGALHGLNPATGWVVAAACGVRAGDRAHAWRALLPIGIGHAASIGWVAAAMALGMSVDRTVLQVAAGSLLLVAVSAHRWRRAGSAASAPAGGAALALWSFMVSSAHGAGLALVPALMPLCLPGGTASALGRSAPLTLAIAAVGVHAVAMLAVTGLVGSGACVVQCVVVDAINRLRGRGKHARPIARQPAAPEPRASGQPNDDSDDVATQRQPGRRMVSLQPSLLPPHVRGPRLRGSPRPSCPESGVGTYTD